MPVDYDVLAESYARFRHRGGPYIAPLVELAQLTCAERILELGAGTGNASAAFLEGHPCRLICVDRSLGMLRQGQRLGQLTAPIQADAAHVPLADGSVDLTLGVYMLHHVSDLAAVFRECARVLRRGCAAFVTASLDYIERHPMNRYFPSFARIDKARFQTEDDIRAAFHEASFVRLGTRRIEGPPRPITPDYVQAVSNRFISTLTLIPEEEFRAGLARLRADVETGGRLDSEAALESLVLWGWRA